MKAGTLYGIGVGPGDPEFITLKAIRILKTIDLIYAASSTKNDHSLALSIARPYISQGTRVELLGFPMTSDNDQLADAWKENAVRVNEALSSGKNAAFLTLGDPLIFSTFGYLLKTLLKINPDALCEIIPGITSYQAAAAKTETILTEAGENLLVASGVCKNGKLKKLLQQADNAVILKTYRDFDRIYDTLGELEMEKHAILVSRCGMDGEKVEYNIGRAVGEKLPYMSLLIVKKNNGIEPH